MRSYEDILNALVGDPQSPELLAGAAGYALALGEMDLATRYVRMLPQDEVPVPKEVVTWAQSKDVRLRHATLRRPRNPAELARIAQLALYASGNVLEIGSGSGDLAIAFAMAGATVYAIDIDPIAVEVGRSKAAALGLTGVRFRLADGSDTGLPSRAFDTVVLAEVLEHVSDPRALLCEARRLVRPGGHVVISVPNEYAIPDWDHHRIWSRSDLEALVRSTLHSRPVWIPGTPPQWLACGASPHVSGSGANTASSTTDLSHYFMPPLENTSPRHRPEVSVIIPTYNRKEWVAESINSWLNQTWDNLEIIVVNDGSTDGTSEVLREYEKEYPGVVRVIHNHKNNGKAAAVNRGLQAVTGKYVTVFDDDDIALPRRLEVQVPYMERHPDVDLLYSGAILFHGNPPRVLQYFGAIEIPSERLLAVECMGNRFHAATILLRTRALLDIGGMDTSLVRAQDYDTWLRLLLRGAQVGALDVPVALQRIHSRVRGTAETPVPYADVVRRTMVDERRIFQKLYPELSLSRLVPDLQRMEHPAVEVEARFTRALIMAKRCLLEEVEEDLKALRELVPRVIALNPRITDYIEKLRATVQECTPEDPAGERIARTIDAMVGTK